MVEEILLLAISLTAQAFGTIPVDGTLILLFSHSNCHLSGIRLSLKSIGQIDYPKRVAKKTVALL
jgi:hypothetical protein